MPLRRCTVSITDANGAEHNVEITAESLYEAVGLGLCALRTDEWSESIPSGNGNVRVTVREPAVEHVVSLRKFEVWVRGTCKGPRERLLKERLRDMLNV